MPSSSSNQSVISLKTPIKHSNTFFYSIDDPNYEYQIKKAILDFFKGKYYKQKKSSSYEKNCSSKNEFKFQHQQIFVSSYLNTETPYRGIVLWHGLGSGKTLSSILISKQTNNEYKLIALLPAMLVDNYYDTSA